jgi:5'-nucleotidase
MASRPLAAVLAALLVALVPGAPALRAQDNARSAFTLSIVGTSDFHGGLLPKDGRGGIGLFSGYVRNLRAARARDRGAVLLIDAGDMFQGTLESNMTEGATVVAAYNRLGYAAAAIGNHEFDFGPVGTGSKPGADRRGALKARAAEARFPFLAANIIDASTGAPVAWPNVHPSVIVSAAGIKVGIVGVTSESTLETTSAANTRGISIGDVLSTVIARARELRSRGARVVILAAHAGGGCTKFDNPTDLTSCDGNSEMFRVMRQLPPGLVDAVVAGHTHNAMAHQVGEVPVVQSYSSARAFGRIDLTVDRASKKVTGRRVFPPRELCAREDPTTHACAPAVEGAASVPATYEGRPVVEEPAIASLVATAAKQVDALKRASLSVVADTPIRRARDEESALGNLVVDLMRVAMPGADVAVTNGGGVRRDLPAGPLTYGDMYEVIPFDNVFARLTMTGGQFRRVIENNLQSTAPILSMSGVRAQWRCQGTAVEVTLVRDSGLAIKDDDQLTIATSDFLATGGDGVFVPARPFTDATTAADTVDLRDTLVMQLRERGGRLREAQLVDPAAPRWTLPRERPVRCGR